MEFFGLFFGLSTCFFAGSMMDLFFKNLLWLPIWFRLSVFFLPFFSLFFGTSCWALYFLKNCLFDLFSFVYWRRRRNVGR